ncbi:MAG: hypothetical protein ACTSPY_17995 [Candidatus Helarchaeota archaeon]
MKEKKNVKLELEEEIIKNTEIISFRNKRRFIRLIYFLFIFIGFTIVQIYLSFNLILTIFIYLILFGVAIYSGINIMRIKNFNLGKIENINKDLNLSQDKFRKILKIFKNQIQETSKITFTGFFLFFSLFGLLFFILYMIINSVSIIFNIGLVIIFNIITILIGISIGIIYQYNTFKINLNFKINSNLKQKNIFLIKFYTDFISKNENLRFVVKIKYIGDYFIILIDKIIVLNPSLEKYGFKCILIQISVSQIIYPYCVLILDKKIVPNVKELVQKNKHIKKTSFKWPIVFETPNSSNESVVVARYDIPDNTSTIPVISISNLWVLYKETIELVINIFKNDNIDNNNVSDGFKDK